MSAKHANTAQKQKLVKLAYVDKTKFLPPKYYELTPTGTALLNVGIEHTPIVPNAKP